MGIQNRRRKRLRKMKNREKRMLRNLTKRKRSEPRREKQKRKRSLKKLPHRKPWLREKPKQREWKRSKRSSNGRLARRRKDLQCHNRRKDRLVLLCTALICKLAKATAAGQVQIYEGAL